MSDDRQHLERLTRASARHDTASWHLGAAVLVLVMLIACHGVPLPC